MENKIAILGAGASGIYCALSILEKFKENNFENFFIDIFDKNSPLLTLLPTGNGRCNITNAIEDVDDFLLNYPRGKKFLKSIFSRYFNSDTLEYFEKIGIKTFKQDDNRVFPVSQSAKDVRKKLLNRLNLFQNFKFIKKEILSSNDIKDYDYIVIALGSRGTKNLIKSFDHTLIPFKKALTGLKTKQFNNLQGVSVKALDGGFVFTKDGISGPCAFKISSINAYKDFPYEVEIKLFDENELFDAIKNNPKKEIGTIVSNFIPKSLAHALIKDYNKKASEISKEKLISYTKLKLTVTSLSSKGEIVNAGGVHLDEIDKNCMSKIHKNLYFIGEILNIDGLTGGFNLQNCWSTAYIAASDITKRIENGK